LSFPHPDYIFHLAAESHVDFSLHDPILFAQSNVIGTINMLMAARELRPELFIQFSTDEVYGSVEGAKLHHEGEPHLPSNPYSASKAAAEDFAHAFYRCYQMPIIITNTMNVFGQRQGSEKFVPKTVRAILKHEPVTVHCRKDQAGNVLEYSSRCWIHARNVASALLFLADGRWKRGERYNIVGERHGIEEMVQYIWEAIGDHKKFPLKTDLVDFHTFNPAHDLNYGLDGSKMAALGWTPPIDFEASLRRTVEWTVARPDWL
jgi:dTDP-D-glucose 4,6-dehydratase